MSVLALRGGGFPYNLPPKLSPIFFLALGAAPPPTAPPGYTYYEN